jgi:hypothetical protein
MHWMDYIGPNPFVDLEYTWNEIKNHSIYWVYSTQLRPNSNRISVGGTLSVELNHLISAGRDATVFGMHTAPCANGVRYLCSVLRLPLQTFLPHNHYTLI